MSEVNKKHFGDPVYKKPVSFGKHFVRNKKDDYIKEKDNKDVTEQNNPVSNDIENRDLVTIEQKHRHFLEKSAIRNNTITSIFGILSWLIFCLALLYVGVTQIENSLIFALSVPLLGFVMIGYLAYLKKVDYGKRSSFEHKQRFVPRENHAFRKRYKHNK